MYSLECTFPEGLQARQLTSVNQKAVPSNTQVAAELLTPFIGQGAYCPHLRHAVSQRFSLTSS